MREEHAAHSDDDSRQMDQDRDTHSGKDQEFNGTIVSICAPEAGLSDGSGTGRRQPIRYGEDPQRRGSAAASSERNLLDRRAAQGLHQSAICSTAL
ncbi:MAG: hypothetical protein Q8O52_17170 [Sulfuritalea sp.]|nr:hypothetical protein [Sulfuritalea sp.]